VIGQEEEWHLDRFVRKMGKVEEGERRDERDVLMYFVG